MTATEQQLKEIRAEIRRLKKLKEAERELASIKQDRIRPVRSTHQIVLKTVSGVFDVAVESILARTRVEPVVVPRQAAMRLSYELCPESSFEEVGRTFNRDHGTIMHAIQAVKNRCDTDPLFAAKYEHAKQLAISSIHPQPAAQGK